MARLDGVSGQSGQGECLVWVNGWAGEHPEKMQDDSLGMANSSGALQSSLV